MKFLCFSSKLHITFRLYTTCPTWTPVKGGHVPLVGTSNKGLLPAQRVPPPGGVPTKKRRSASDWAGPRALCARSVYNLLGAVKSSSSAVRVYAGGFFLRLFFNHTFILTFVYNNLNFYYFFKMISIYFLDPYKNTINLCPIRNYNLNEFI